VRTITFHDDVYDPREDVWVKATVTAQMTDSGSVWIDEITAEGKTFRTTASELERLEEKAIEADVDESFAAADRRWEAKINESRGK
jgi:hypothetical protein